MPESELAERLDRLEKAVYQLAQSVMLGGRPKGAELKAFMEDVERRELAGVN